MDFMALEMLRQLLDLWILRVTIKQSNELKLSLFQD